MRCKSKWGECALLSPYKESGWSYYMGIPACFFKVSDICSLPLHVIQLTLNFSCFNADLLASIGVCLADGAHWGQEQRVPRALAV